MFGSSLTSALLLTRRALIFLQNLQSFLFRIAFEWEQVRLALINTLLSLGAAVLCWVLQSCPIKAIKFLLLLNVLLHLLLVFENLLSCEFEDVCIGQPVLTH